jgi:heterodisulfide reductase subunit C1
VNFLSQLKKDVRFIGGLKACINCGTCTAICPAAQFYDYDPMLIVNIVQRGDEGEIEKLLKSDTIWFCGQCLSCKTRCPRGNTPGYIIQALRQLAQQSGLFTCSERGRQQLRVKRIVGDTILKYGYCVYVDEINTEEHPEQGPVWDWFRKNTETVTKRLGANYKGNGAGSLRKISEADLNELRQIFRETGALERFEVIEKNCCDERR